MLSKQKGLLERKRERMAISKQQNRFCKKVVDFKSDRRETDRGESDRLLMHKMVERERERESIK